MNRTIKTVVALTLALAWMPACDKGKDDKAAAKGDAKADKADKADKAEADKAEADPHAGMHHGDAKPEAKSEETAEAVADGRVDISVDASGYHPATISAPAKAKITLAFTRTTDSGCGQKLVIKALDISKDLPLDEVVEIEVEVPETGELGFACGMDMYKGKVVPKA
jgi:hypothetical protein